MKITKNDNNKFASIFLFVVVSSLILWFITILYEGIQSTQYSIFFDKCNDLFADFTNISGYSSTRDVYLNPINGPGQKGYPPLPYIIAYVFSRIAVFDTVSYRDIYAQKMFLIIFVIFISMLLSLVNWIISEELKGSKLFRLTLAFALTYSNTMLFSIERANLIIFTLLFLLVYIFWYDNDSKILREFSLISLALAISFKLTPAILGVFLLFEKRYFDILRLGIYSLILVFLPFLFFNGGFNNISVMLYNMNEFFKTYSDLEGIGFKAIIYNLISYFIKDFQFSNLTNNIVDLISISSSILLLFTSWMNRQKWKRVLTITFVLLLIPKISHQYNALYLLPSLVLFLNEKNRGKGDFIILVSFIIMSSVYYIPNFDKYSISLFMIYIYLMMISIVNINNFLKSFLVKKNYK